MRRCLIVLFHIKVRDRDSPCFCYFRYIAPSSSAIHVVEFASLLAMRLRVGASCFLSSFVKLFPYAIVRGFGTCSFGRRAHTVIVSRRNTLTSVFFSCFHPVQRIPAFCDPSSAMVFQSNVMFARCCLFRFGSICTIVGIASCILRNFPGTKWTSGSLCTSRSASVMCPFKGFSPVGQIVEFLSSSMEGGSSSVPCSGTGVTRSKVLFRADNVLLFSFVLSDLLQ